MVKHEYRLSCMKLSKVKFVDSMSSYTGQRVGLRGVQTHNKCFIWNRKISDSIETKYKTVFAWSSRGPVGLQIHDQIAAMKSGATLPFFLFRCVLTWLDELKCPPIHCGLSVVKAGHGTPGHTACGCTEHITYLIELYKYIYISDGCTPRPFRQL